MQVEELLLIFAEGNPGAETVLKQLNNLGRIDIVKYLYHRKITGAKLWALYKFSNQNIHLMIKNIIENDKKMFLYLKKCISLGHC